MSGAGACSCPTATRARGPEHSSARVERFLQLCAEDNIQVANCTTPAQYFHLLRRQMRRRFRAPLVVFTPKSLLRDPRAASAAGRARAAARFQPVLDDPRGRASPGSARRVLLCSGKVYYDLLERARARAAARGGAARRRARARRAALPVARRRRSPRPSRATPGAEASSGCRRSPRTWAPGPSCASGCGSCSAPARACATPAAASASPAVGSLRIHRREQAALLDAAFQ